MAEQKTGKISVWAATIIGVNAMIGAGIFAMPGRLAFSVGPVSVLSYALSAFLILSVVLALGRLSLLHPGDAWGYRYPAVWGGHGVGLVAAFGYIGGVIIAMGFLTQQLGVWVSSWVGYNPLLVGLFLLALIVALVLAGAEVSAVGQYVIAACVLIPMLFAGSVCWLNAHPHLLSTFAPYGYKPIILSLPYILFSMLGFESIASLYRIVENPEKNVPRAALYSVLIVAGMFSFFIAGALVALHPGFFVGGLNQAFADALAAGLPAYGWLRPVISLGAFFAIFGTLHSMLWSVAELLFDTVGKIKATGVRHLIKHKVITVPAAVLVVALGTAASTLLLKADIIMQAAACFILVTYVLSVLALVFDKKTWRTPFYALVAVVALVSMACFFWIGVESLFASL